MSKNKTLIPKEWLKEKLEKETFKKECSNGSHWENFNNEIKDDDEIWTFSSDQFFWDHLIGRSGIALVRNGKIVKSIVTKMN